MNTEIKDWLNSQQDWLQEAALRILKHGSLTPGDVGDLVLLLKNPPASGGEKRTYPTMGASSPSSTLRLVSIGTVEGIDALAPRKPLEFLDHEAVSTVITGASRPDQARANAAMSSLPPLPSDLHEWLAAFYQNEVAPHVRGPV